MFFAIQPSLGKNEDFEMLFWSNVRRDYFLRSSASSPNTQNNLQLTKIFYSFFSLVKIQSPIFPVRHAAPSKSDIWNFVDLFLIFLNSSCFSESTRKGIKPIRPIRRLLKTSKSDFENMFNFRLFRNKNSSLNALQVLAVLGEYTDRNLTKKENIWR